MSDAHGLYDEFGGTTTVGVTVGRLENMAAGQETSVSPEGGLGQLGR